MNNINQVFLLLTDNYSADLVKFFIILKQGTKKFGKSFILFHQKGHPIPKEIMKQGHYTFTYKSLSDLNYYSIAEDLIPGSNHFPVLQFYLKHPNYNYYWCIEDDVRFSGDWEYFFSHFTSFQQDFISCHIYKHEEYPHWPWWNALMHPTKSIPLDQRIRSFNPIYRISERALRFIHNALRDKWCGHHEVLIPTLLYNAGYNILDFGGSGSFILQAYKNKFYSSSKNSEGQLFESTMRWRPLWKNIGGEKNKLYHPVKIRML